MIFNSFNFIVIFPLLFLLYYAIPAKYNNMRNVFLLFTSYLLYMNFKPVYALILLFVTVITYCFALLVTKHAGNKVKRKQILSGGGAYRFAAPDCIQIL